MRKKEQLDSIIETYYVRNVAARFGNEWAQKNMNTIIEHRNKSERSRKKDGTNDA